jgi:hypothetical protein
MATKTTNQEAKIPPKKIKLKQLKGGEERWNLKH